MFWEAQRLAANDDAVSILVVADVGALFERAHGDVTAFYEGINAISGATHRGSRDVVWVVSPASDPSHAAFLGWEASFAAEIQRAGGKVVQSGEPTPSLVYHALRPHRVLATIVTTGVEDRLWDLWALDGNVTSILDVGTGRLWRREDFTDVDPAVQSRVEAELRKATNKPQERYRQALGEARTRGEELATARLPSWFVRGVDDHAGEIAWEEFVLRGLDRFDPAARHALDAIVAKLPSPSPSPSLASGYVCADVQRGVTKWRLRRLACRLAGAWHEVSSEHEAAVLLGQLHAAHPTRWFGPRMIDLLCWMRGHQLAFPDRALDPAWVAFALDPEQPRDLAALSPRVLGLPPRSRAWLADLRREEVAPGALGQVGRCLPSLDADLVDEARLHRLDALIEDDIGATLPVLAAIEHRGVRLHVPRGCADWGAVNQRVQTAMTSYASGASNIVGAVDYFRNYTLTVRAIEKRIGKLPSTEREGMPIKDQLDRYVEQFKPVLTPIAQARTLGAFLKNPPLWREVNAGAGTLHAQTVPTTTGRLGLRAPALHALPKRGSEAVLLRSALRAANGHVLVSADYNGFEARLAAELSQDPVMTAAAAGHDIYLELAKVFFATQQPSSDDRERAKVGLLAILYGQTRDRFWKTTHTMARVAAEGLYDTVVAALPGLVTFRDREHAQIRTNAEVRTVGGWRRLLHDKFVTKRLRQGFNALIQGAGADVLRRVLRVLAHELKPYDAGVVHHAHDEVVVEVPWRHRAAGRVVLKHVMETACKLPEPLVSTVPLFVKKVRVGVTWARLI